MAPIPGDSNLIYSYGYKYFKISTIDIVYYPHDYSFQKYLFKSRGNVKIGSENTQISIARQS